MFIDNKYTVWYFRIVSNCVQRKTNISIFEKHHIIPRSLGGTDNESNIVKLSPREHFVCHLLLTKMTTGNDKRKMVFAAKCLANVGSKGNIFRISSRTIERLRKEANFYHKEYWSDPKNRAAQSERIKQKWTDEMRKNQSLRVRSRLTPDYRQKLSFAQKNKWTDEMRKEASEKQKELNKDPTLRRKKANIGAQNGMYGRTHSDEVKRAQSERAKLQFTGKSYEKIHGAEKAAELRSKRSLAMKGRDNKGSNNPRFDHSAYTFIHIDGSSFTGLRSDFLQTFQHHLNAGDVTYIIKHKQCRKGWKLI